MLLAVSESCVAAIEAMRFSCMASAVHFLFLGGKNENTKQNFIALTHSYSLPVNDMLIGLRQFS